MASCWSTILQQRNAKVVRNKPCQVRFRLQLREHFDGFGRLACRHVDVRSQELDVVLDLRRHRTFDSRQSFLCIIELTFLEMDSGESECGLVSHGLVDRAFEHRLDGATRALVHAVVELEVADGELGVVDVKVKRVESGLVESVIHRQLRVEPLDCIEELSLVARGQRLAEIQVFQVNGRGRGGESQDQTKCDEPAWRLIGSPYSQRDRSGAGTRSGASVSSQKLRFDFLAEGKVFGAAEVGAAFELAVDKHLELVHLRSPRCRYRCRCTPPLRRASSSLKL